MRALALAALLLVLVPAIARAGPGTCTMSATNINFGIYSGTQITATGTITLMCSGGSNNNTVQIGLSYGSTSMNFPSSTANRLMSNGANRLAYQMYSDSTHSTIWGDGSSGTSRPTIAVNYVPPANNPVTVQVPVFAVLPAGALPPFGPYVDTIVATLFGANPVTTMFQVTANTLPTCSVSASNLNFGNYSRLQVDGTTTLSATCTLDAGYNLGLDQGTSTGATVTTRKMTGPASALLGYSLFRDSARTLNWGDSVGTDTVASTGTGLAQTFTVFGRIPASQSAAPGMYTDTITVTLTF
jgi:spore coat protein U-like protein